MEITIDNIKIIFIIGSNAKHNTQIVLDAHENDLWFHLNDLPSAHIIAKISDIELTKKQYKEVIIRGAKISKMISKYSSSKHLDISYTTIKYVKTTNTPGLVNLEKYHIITV
jgi:predicted ribosome quality control (RQC) complex YloA/Tae2 family protein